MVECFLAKEDVVGSNPISRYFCYAKHALTQNAKTRYTLTYVLNFKKTYSYYLPLVTAYSIQLEGFMPDENRRSTDRKIYGHCFY